MKNMVIATAGIACAAAIFVPQANAEPIAGYDTIVLTHIPKMTCQIFSAASDTSGDGAGVDCQATFPQAPPVPTQYADGTVGPPLSTPNQAMITAAGNLSYFTGNIGMGGGDEVGPPKFDTLETGNTYHIQGWTVFAAADGITFTNAATNHGMTIDSAAKVTAF